MYNANVWLQCVIKHTNKQVSCDLTDLKCTQWPLSTCECDTGTQTHTQPHTHSDRFFNLATKIAPI